ncbi:MAG: hypothetical protein J3Q66DRAFT_441736 [Benniella sp.]|nr:MAG: hypothetical protein J3Q66DRAFT_441736 [Benniella sp.]
MVSKIVALALLGALASHVNAYYWHGEISYEKHDLQATAWKIHPVDVQVPGNEALVWEVTDPQGNPPEPIFDQYGYLNVYPGLLQSGGSGPQMTHLVTMVDGAMIAFACTKMDEIQLPGSSGSTITRRVYRCQNPDYFGVKGTPIPKPTTTPVATTPCPVATVTVPVTVTTATPPKPTTTPPKPSPTCAAGFIGKKNGQGRDGACCSHSNDCRDTCVNGICRDRCLTGFEGKKNGKGPNGACCSHSNDCKDTCVWGICGVHP